MPEAGYNFRDCKDSTFTKHLDYDPPVVQGHPDNPEVDEKGENGRSDAVLFDKNGQFQNIEEHFRNLITARRMNKKGSISREYSRKQR